jgi:ASC-1-like (ASCH) protein
MHHVAIMNKSWQLIPKILSGQKTIESRWYQTKRTPWDKISNGDLIYFKNSGEAITASAKVGKVLQFNLKNTDDIQYILNKYGKGICLVNTDVDSWGKLPKYCVLIFLTNAKKISKPFHINKTGFGSATAWLTLPNINSIKIDGNSL